MPQRFWDIVEHEGPFVLAQTWYPALPKNDTTQLNGMRAFEALQRAVHLETSDFQGVWNIVTPPVSSARSAIVYLLLSLGWGGRDTSYAQPTRISPANAKLYMAEDKSQEELQHTRLLYPACQVKGLDTQLWCMDYDNVDTIHVAPKLPAAAGGKALTHWAGPILQEQCYMVAALVFRQDESILVLPLDKGALARVAEAQETIIRTGPHYLARNAFERVIDDHVLFGVLKEDPMYDVLSAVNKDLIPRAATSPILNHFLHLAVRAKTQMGATAFDSMVHNLGASWFNGQLDS